MLRLMALRGEISPHEGSELAALRKELESLRAREREHQRELERLQRSEEHYRVMVEQAEDGFFLADECGIYLGSNAALRNMLGYSEEDLRGKHIKDMVDPQDLERTPLRVHEVQSKPRVVAPRKLRRRDGGVVYTEVVASRLPDGKFEAVVRDVSERVRADAERARLTEELRHAQKMESIGRLAGGIAHDFNNLLLVILAHAHVAKRRYGELIASELDSIISAAERGGALTRQLLSFSRKRASNPTSIDLNRIVRGMHELLERLMSDHTTFELRLSEVPCRLVADASQLEQVIMNLVVNARDACAACTDARITIETELGEARAPNASGEDVILRVRDSGQGMDEATVGRIFEPFFTTKAPGQGTGLGLSMVYGIVTQNGGTISVQSLPGIGSVFELRFGAEPAARGC
jgi:PAS domain S-box-containing protein